MGLPKNAKVGQKVTQTKMVKGKKRRITWKKTRPRGKNKNLTWRITSNKSA